MASFTKYQSAKGIVWRASFRIVDTDGKCKQKTLRGYKTKKDAEKAYSAYMLNYIPKVETPPAAAMVTFGNAMNAYLTQLKIRVKESSLLSFRQRFEKISEHWKDVAINDITPPMLLEWQAEIMNRYNSSYGQTLCSEFAAIIRYAHRFYKTNSDFLDAVDKPKVKEKIKEEMKIWTTAQYAEVRQCLVEPYRTYYDFLFCTGCRKNEASAMQVCDIDFVNNTVYIHRNLTRQRGSIPYKLTTPKSARSVRRIALSAEIIQEIKTLLVGRNEGFVFSLVDGSAPIPNTTSERYFRNATAKAGVPPIRIHDLRHSHASLLISQGVSIVAVSRRLGHSDVAETLNTYAHLMPEDNQKIKQILSDITLNF